MLTQACSDAERLAEPCTRPPSSSLPANGNRLGHSSATDTSTATYDTQDRLLRYGRTQYTYTPAGDLYAADDGASDKNYIYDAMGNLTMVGLQQGDTVITYLVDGLGRGVARLRDWTVTHKWLYGDRLGPIAELDGSGSLVARYVYGPAVNVPEYMVKSGSTYRIVSDQLGSVRLVVDVATGDVLQRMSYDAYGRVVEDTNPGFQCFGYAGGLWDATTGLVRFGARDYDPEVGRWLTKDPAGMDAGSTNSYAYAAGDPVNLVDPDGRVAILPLVAAGAAFGAVVGGGFYLVAANDHFTWGGLGGALLGGAIDLLPGTGLRCSTAVSSICAASSCAPAL
jgi:RHS repeat-associated protein